ncbi:MAG TPA: integrase core domain-containing protein [Phycisphaerae bacterium]|nr:integrase core domain-containing protein [Phycisphaerae bacterium]
MSLLVPLRNPSLSEANYVVNRWRLDYNHHRPHSGLDWMTPAAFAATCAAPGSAMPHPPQHTQEMTT